jgi:hypothetical protein
VSQREVARVKARYDEARGAARVAAARNLSPHLGAPLTLGGWGARAQQAYMDHWSDPPLPGRIRFDWVDIFRESRNSLDRLDLAIWANEDWLSGLALITTTARAVVVRFVEGTTKGGCPFKGKRALIAFEAAACFGQRCGKAEIYAEPVNVALEQLYICDYGFAPAVVNGKRMLTKPI